MTGIPVFPVFERVILSLLRPNANYRRFVTDRCACAKTISINQYYVWEVGQRVISRSSKGIEIMMAESVGDDSFLNLFWKLQLQRSQSVPIECDELDKRDTAIRVKIHDSEELFEILDWH